MKLAAVTGAKVGPLLISIVVLPLIMLLAVLSYSWPAGRIAPRAVPIGVVATNPAGEQVALSLQQKEPGAFDVTLYGSDAAARSAIQNREVYGALEMTPGHLTTFTASAASSTVAQLLTQVTSNIATQSAAHGKPLTVTIDDVVPASPGDPHGAVLSSALVPLTVCSVILAAGATVFLRLRPAWRHLTGVAVLASLAALGGYLITQCFLGAFPGQHLETWATLALLIFSVSSAVAGTIALIGPAAVGLGVALFVFVGIPFSGSSSAPEMLPKSVDVIGQLLPPGAGQSLLRDTAFFNGHGPLSHLMVLIGWSLFGILADIAGHHSVIGFASRRHRAAHNAKQAQQLDASTEPQVTAADQQEPTIYTDPVQLPTRAAHAAAHAAGPAHHAPAHAWPAAAWAAQTPAGAPGAFQSSDPYPTQTPPYVVPTPPYTAPTPQPNAYRSASENLFEPAAPDQYPTPAPSGYPRPVPTPTPMPFEPPTPDQYPTPTQSWISVENATPPETQTMDRFIDPQS